VYTSCGFSHSVFPTTLFIPSQFDQYYLVSMVHFVPEENFPDLPAGWTARDYVPKGRHATFRSKLKLKFTCPLCIGKESKWTSMKGTVEFKISGQRNQQNIMCLIYDQQHMACRTWVAGNFYQHEYEDLVLNVVEKFSNPDSNREVRRKKGKPKSDHETEFCEAFTLGICRVVICVL